MATIGTDVLTLNDWRKRLSPEGNIDAIIELLAEKNPILDDMMFKEGNLATGHRTTVRSGIPEGTWRLLNYGVQPTKSQTVQVTDSTGMLENYSEIDKALADLNGNSAEFRMSEDMGIIQGLNNQMASTVFYGNTKTHPARFMGLAPRFNDGLASRAENGENILNGGGSGSDNTSVWMVLWGSNTVHGIFPKGSIAGLQHKDLGEQTLFDVNGGRYQGYRAHYKWDIGLTVRDWRAIVRIANIDVSELTMDASANSADLIDLLTQMVEIPFDINAGRASIYCNKTIRSFLRRQINNKANVNLSLENYYGKKVVMFDGIPVQRCDGILNTESVVPFT